MDAMGGSGERGSDLRWTLTLTPDEAERGCERDVVGRKVAVPPNTQHGAMLRFNGLGEPGFAGAAPGDLLVTIGVQGMGGSPAPVGTPVRNSRGLGIGCAIMAGLCGLGCVTIPIVAAILFPVFAKAREKAREASCVSNCKQLGIAMMQYSVDYDDSLPPNQNGAGSWPQLLQPYLLSSNVLRCPSALSDPPDYRYRAVPVHGVNPAKLKEPERQVMGIDGDANQIVWRHRNEYADAWFLDGHAKLLTQSTASSQYYGLDGIGASGRMPAEDPRSAHSTDD